MSDFTGSVHKTGGHLLFVLQAILLGCHTEVFAKDLKKSGFRSVTDRTCDMADSFFGGTKQPGSPVHSGAKLLLPEGHAIVFVQHSGKLPFGEVEKTGKVIFPGAVSKVLFKKVINHGESFQICCRQTWSDLLVWHLPLPKKFHHQQGDKGLRSLCLIRIFGAAFQEDLLTEPGGLYVEREGRIAWE